MKTQRSTTECSFVKIFVLRLTTDDIGSKRTNHIFDVPARFARRIFLFHRRFLLFEIVHFFFFKSVGDLPESCFMFARFTFKTKVVIIL